LDDLRRSLGLRTIELRTELRDAPGYSVACGYWHELALSHEPEEVYRRLNRLRRRLLRRAKTTGVVVRRATREADLCDVFFRLHVETRRRLGVPAQPRRLFELLWRKVMKPGCGFLSVAYLSSAPIAAAVFLTSHGRIMAKFSATDRVYATSGGMDSVYWNAIEWGCENGYEMFDFGRTEYGNDGLRLFKLSWGVREEPLAYTFFAKEPPAQRGPRLTSAVGLVIRNSPSWMTRAVGHAAYRFTA
jgi:CelD/BcsL family acetyltransferase involved in cellulose biosynthesis